MTSKSNSSLWMNDPHSPIFKAIYSVICFEILLFQKLKLGCKDKLETNPNTLSPPHFKFDKIISHLNVSFCILDIVTTKLLKATIPAISSAKHFSNDLAFYLFLTVLSVGLLSKPNLDPEKVFKPTDFMSNCSTL